MAQQGGKFSSQGRFNFQIGFKPDKSGIEETKKGFEDLKKSLQELQKIKPVDFEGSRGDLRQLKNTVMEVQAAFSTAYNPTLNTVNIQTFNNKIKETGLSLSDIQASFSKAGAKGDVAFSQLTRSVLTTNLQLKQTHSILDDFGKTFANAIKMGAALGTINLFTKTIQGAITYAQSLDKSLTDIRIVTGDSSDQMQKFAASANEAAQSLGRSTMEYSKAALTFYQQGLNDQDVATRTEAVLKAQNITGAGSQMADYLTSVWNGYKVANEQAQLYVDKLAAVADSSASNMSQLAIGMSKVASTASAMGVNVDQLNAQLATVVATTRQAPEAVGTAFKTIYTRLNDIKAGADQAEVSLGNYSSRMASLGFNVLNSNNQLRDTGQIMEQIGQRWETLTRQQQIYLATTMGGQRQVNQLMALFENWTTYSELLNTSLEAEGTLAEKNSRYMDSLGAKMEQLGAAGQRVKSSLIEADSFKFVVENLTSAVDTLGFFIESIGGGGAALLSLGGIATQVFSKTIATEINAIVSNMQNAKENANLLAVQIDKINEAAKDEGIQNNKITETWIKRKQQVQKYYDIMSQENKMEYDDLIRREAKLNEQLAILKEKVDLGEAFNKKVSNMSRSQVGSERFEDFVSAINGQITKLEQAKERISEVPLRIKVGEDAYKDIQNLRGQLASLEAILGKDYVKDLGFKELREEIDKTNISSTQLKNKIQAIINALSQRVSAGGGLDQSRLEFERVKGAAENATGAVKDYQKALEQKFEIQNLVSTIGAFGQLASSLTSLQNAFKILNDESANSGEKILKFVTALTFSITSAIGAYSTLNKTLELNTMFQTANVAMHAVSTTTQAAEASATGVLTAAKLALAKAQAAVNAAYAESPLGLAALVITGLIAVVAGAAAIYDKFTMSVKQADQALNEFDKKVKSTKDSVKTFNQDLSNLDKAKEEWKTLSDLAGNYNSTIDNLTQEEKQRYYELSNLIAKYNDDAIVGYDQQGNAIIRLNQKLDDTIAKLKEERQAEIDSTYSGPEYEKVQEAKQIKYDDAYSDLSQKQQSLEDALSFAANSLRTRLIASGDELDEELKKYRDRLTKILQQGEEGVFKNREQLMSIFTALTDFDPSFNFDTLNNIKQYEKDYELALKDFNKEVDSLTNNQQIINVLQTKDYNDSYEKAKDAGISNLDYIIDGYIQGLREELPEKDFLNAKEIAEQINKNFLDPITESLSQQKGGQSIYENLIDSIFLDENINTENFKNLGQKNEYIKDFFNNFIENNRKQLKELLEAGAKDPEVASSLQQFFANLFDVDDLNIDFNTGKVENVISTKVQALANRVNYIINDGINLPEGTLNWISSLLPSDIDQTQLDYIIKNLDEAIKKTGNVIQAIQELSSESKTLQNLNTNLDTLDLLNRQASGQNLGKKELEQLEKGIQTLEESYPGLVKQVNILNTEWLRGTQKYKQALSDLKQVLLDTIAQAALQGQSQQETNESVINLISSMEDLQMVQSKHILDIKGKQDALIKVTSEYDNCKEKIEAYRLALGTANEEEAKGALQRAAYASQMGQQYDIDPERISNLADSYAKLAESNEEAYSGLDTNAELAADAATRYIRLNDAVADLQKNYDDVVETLQAVANAGLAEVYANEDLSDTFKQIKKDVAGIIDVSQNLLNDDWIAGHLQEIQAAADGSQEAINSLRDAAAKQILINLNIDYSSLDSSAQAVANWANNLPEGQLGIDDTIFLQKLVTAMQDAGMAQAEIENALSGIGIDVDLSPYKEGLNEAIDAASWAGQSASDYFAKNAGVNTTITSATDTAQDTVQAPGYDAIVTPQPVSISLPTVVPAYFPGMVLPQFSGNTTQTGYYPEIEISPKTQSVPASKETTAMGLQVVGATKSSGGKISHKNSIGGNKKSSGGSKGRKKGGKGKSSTPKTPKTQKPVTDTPDRYHDVNIQLKDIATEFQKVQKQQEKLTGKDLLNNLDKQLKLLEKQVAIYKQKLELQHQEADQLKKTLRSEGITFGADGRISNYTTVLANALAEYNKAIAEYNKLSAEQQQKNKDMISNAKQKYETLKKNIQRYDTVITEEIPNLNKQIQQIIDKQIEINIQKFKLKIDLRLDLSQAERDFNEFKKKIIKQVRDDDIVQNVKFSFKDIPSYYDSVKALTEHVNNTLLQIQAIDQTGTSSVYGNNKAKALQDLKDYTEKLMDNLENVEDTVQKIKKSIFDAISAADKAFDEQKKEYDYVSDLIDHNVKLTKLMYGDDAYKTLQKYYKLQEDNNNKELDFLKRQKNMWYYRMMQEQKNMNSLTEGSNEWKESKDKFEEYKKLWMDATKDLNASIEKSLQNIIDKYSNVIDKVFDKLNKKITNGKGLNNINEQWELINKQADMYLDKVNSMYAIDKLQGAYRDAIKDNEGDLTAQRSLNDMMNEQLKYLRDKDKLTQYDVDRANALLQIEIKRLALQQSRQNKTKLRLRRDSQGNYTYQYTADEQASKEAQQSLADAENKLYNMTKQAYKNNLDSYYSNVEDWQDKIKQVYKDTTLTTEEQQQKIAMLNEYYGNIINNLTDDNNNLRRFMMEDTFNEMAKMYNTDVENFKKMTNQEKNTIMNDMIPYWDSGLQEMANKFAGQGGFIPVTQQAFKQLGQATKDYVNSLNNLQDAAKINFDEVEKGLDKNINKAEQLLDKNQDLIQAYRDQIVAIQDVINNVSSLVAEYNRAKEAAIEATQAAFNYNKNIQKESSKNNTSSSVSTGTNKTKTNSSNKNNSSSSGKTDTLDFTKKTVTKDGLNLDFYVLNPETIKTIEDFSSTSSKISNENNVIWGKNDSSIGKVLSLDGIKETKKLSSDIKITKTLIDILQNFESTNMSDLSNNISKALNTNNKSSIEQDVKIQANFPNVSDRNEIEKALQSLVLRASQYTSKNKK